MGQIDKTVEGLNGFINKNQGKINTWLNTKMNKDVPIYSSVDIRNAGFKIVPVDTNLFPSGFNNLSQKSLEIATTYFLDFFTKNFPNVKKIAVITEGFTRNTGYWQNIKTLLQILKNTNLEIKFIALHDELLDAIKDVKVFKCRKQDDTLIIGERWSPDLILLNNDLTEKIPEELIGIDIPILPNLRYGWHNRKKYLHYQAYNHLVHQFCNEFGIDPWLISAYFTKCKNISFRKKEGLECIAENVDSIIIKIRQKYDEYQIKEAPVVFIKANNGTFGRGIISVKNGKEVMNLNKKLRHSLDAIKGNTVNSEVVIQEGIKTIEKFKNYPAENIIYLINGKIIGKFARYNINKDINHNLNSKGMFFTQFSDVNMSIEALVSRIATIAVAYE